MGDSGRMEAWRMMWRKWRKNGGAILSGLFLLLLVLASIGNTFWNDGDVSQTVLLKGEDVIISAPPFPPSKDFLLGTDEKGYDLLGRAIRGSQVEHRDHDIDCVFEDILRFLDRHGHDVCSELAVCEA